MEKPLAPSQGGQAASSQNRGLERLRRFGSHAQGLGAPRTSV